MPQQWQSSRHYFFHFCTCTFRFFVTLRFAFQSLCLKGGAARHIESRARVEEQTRDVPGLVLDIFFVVRLTRRVQKKNLVLWRSVSQEWFGASIRRFRGRVQVVVAKHCFALGRVVTQCNGRFICPIPKHECRSSIRLRIPGVTRRNVLDQTFHVLGAPSGLIRQGAAFGHASAQAKVKVKVLWWFVL